MSTDQGSVAPTRRRYTKAQKDVPEWRAATGRSSIAGVTSSVDRQGREVVTTGGAIVTAVGRRRSTGTRGSCSQRLACQSTLVESLAS